MMSEAQSIICEIVQNVHSVWGKPADAVHAMTFLEVILLIILIVLLWR